MDLRLTKTSQFTWHGSQAAFNVHLDDKGGGLKDSSSFWRSCAGSRLSVDSNVEANHIYRLKLVQKPAKQSRADVSLHDCRQASGRNCRVVKGAAARNRLGKKAPNTGTGIPLDLVIMHVFISQTDVVISCF